MRAESWMDITLTSACALVIVVFGSLVICRWWWVRQSLQRVVSRTQNLCATLSASHSVNSYKLEEDSKAEALEAQRQVYRYVNLAYALVFKVARKENNVSDLQSTGLLSEEEMLLLSALPQLSPSVVYGWCGVLIHRLAAAGLCGEVSLTRALGDLAGASEEASVVLGLVEAPLPYIAVQAVSIVLHAFYIQVVVISSGVVGRAMGENDSSIMFGGYLTLCLMVVVFSALSSLFYLLANPLNSSPSSLPVDTMRENCEKECDMLFRSMLRVTASSKSDTSSRLTFAASDFRLTSRNGSSLLPKKGFLLQSTQTQSTIGHTDTNRERPHQSVAHVASLAALRSQRRASFDGSVSFSDKDCSVEKSSRRSTLASSGNGSSRSLGKETSPVVGSMRPTFKDIASREMTTRKMQMRELHETPSTLEVSQDTGTTVSSAPKDISFY
eukprot:CAMPEP_0185030556 /NCGR_PEP_ID=MMETSP1103-20130426/17541_1 /TAXON_ID=36769 /ORGANISM="Paraphysomonas bandaiensis, Strain Caron Lab Isolate" /LENGTH=440 /DNA_ID=CAMNT_0027565739 /DNA_START=454 /DNA_END=1776 /DNA_ORIENTATION=-